jgi:hypothetical protein
VNIGDLPPTLSAGCSVEAIRLGNVVDGFEAGTELGSDFWMRQIRFRYQGVKNGGM